MDQYSLPYLLLADYFYLRLRSFSSLTGWSENRLPKTISALSSASKHLIPSSSRFATIDIRYDATRWSVGLPLFLPSVASSSECLLKKAEDKGLFPSSFPPSSLILTGMEVEAIFDGLTNWHSELVSVQSLYLDLFYLLKFQGSPLTTSLVLFLLIFHISSPSNYLVASSNCNTKCELLLGLSIISSSSIGMGRGDSSELAFTWVLVEDFVLKAMASSAVCFKHWRSQLKSQSRPQADGASVSLDLSSVFMFFINIWTEPHLPRLITLRGCLISQRALPIKDT